MSSCVWFVSVAVVVAVDAVAATVVIIFGGIPNRRAWKQESRRVITE